jgi:hypothetical protein
LAGSTCLPETIAVALPGIPPWTDQDIVLYHGTLGGSVASILRAVDPTVCKHLRDFGRGFYTTTNLVQAQRWANDLAIQAPGEVAAVVEFTVERNDLAGLDCLFFVRGTGPQPEAHRLVRPRRRAGHRLLEEANRDPGRGSDLVPYRRGR